MKISHRDFFERYLNPHKDEVAEWGAEIGLWQRDRSAALERIARVVETTMSQAGLGSSVHFDQAKARLESREERRDRALARLGDIFEEWSGAGATVTTGSKQRPHILKNFAGVVLLPLYLIVLWPAIAIAHWSFLRHEARERERGALAVAAKNYLLFHFERHADRGEVAADIQGKSVTQKGVAHER